MKKNIIPFLILAILMLPALFSPTVIFAKEGESGGNSGSSKITVLVTGTVKPTEIEKTEKVEGTRKPNELNDKVADKCEKVTNKVDDTVKKYTKNKEDNTNRYNGATQSLNKIVKKFQEKNLDTTILESEVAVLNTKIQKFNTDMNTMISDIQSAKVDFCKNIISGTPKPSTTLTPIPSLTTQNKENSSKLLKRRQDLAIVKSDIEDIKNYYKNVIKPTIQELRHQLETSTSKTPEVTETIKPTI